MYILIYITTHTHILSPAVMDAITREYSRTSIRVLDDTTGSIVSGKYSITYIFQLITGVIYTTSSSSSRLDGDIISLIKAACGQIMNVDASAMTISQELIDENDSNFQFSLSSIGFPQTIAKDMQSKLLKSVNDNSLLRRIKMLLKSSSLGIYLFR